MKYFALLMSLEVSLRDSLTELSTSFYFPSTLCFQPGTHHTCPFYYPCTHSCKFEGAEKSSQQPHYCTKRSCLHWVASICLCSVHDCVVGFSNAKLEQYAIVTWIFGPLTTPQLLTWMSTNGLQHFWDNVLFHNILLSCYETQLNFRTREELIYSLKYTKIDFAISIATHYDQISK